MKNYRERDNISSDDINNKELKWWNDNAELISEVWEIKNNISWKIRKSYLKNAKAFFNNNCKSTYILEIGCGSGWVGQSIANPKLNIIGTDFSKTQIRLAIKRAKVNKVHEFCNYILIDSSNYLKDVKEINGILIHSFLHHLDVKGIDNLFNSIKKNMKRGTKIWIYEPAYYNKRNEQKSGKLDLIVRLLFKLTQIIIIFLDKIYDKYNLIDKKVVDDFKLLINLANENKWYLSPKEVPFEIYSFSKKLEKNFKIKDKYWATIYLIGWVFKSNRIKNKYLRDIINAIILPIFVFTENLIIKNNNYLKQSIIKPNYAFYVWECLIK